MHVFHICHLFLSIIEFFSAIDLINNLLQVKMRKRYSVDKTLSHPWLQVNINHWTFSQSDGLVNIYKILILYVKIFCYILKSVILISICLPKCMQLLRI